MPHHGHQVRHQRTLDVPCGNGPDQFWNADHDDLHNLGGNSLRTSANGDAVYSTPWGQGGIETARWTWCGTHY
ncbi:hypothetical protein ABZ864_37105 [Streptomyces sp. NPDC047082]|uniref:hypothetical protein n=1 Tax=Streptomyces sp. NPDC047082 TaxID=3155259 RepID=UPI0033CC975B